MHLEAIDRYLFSHHSLKFLKKTIPRFFADDTALLITDDTPEELKLRTNSELARISEWMLCNALALNTSKTNALFITPYLRKANLPISFTLNNTR